MRVFLDANVLVAAFATRGICADVVRNVLAEHQLLVGEVVLTELSRVLRQRLRLPAAAIEAALLFLGEHEIVPKPAQPSNLPKRDPDDRWILASALAGKADLLVTGDRDLLDLGGSAPLLIVDPRAYWELTRHR